MRASRSKWLAASAVLAVLFVGFLVAIVAFEKPRSAMARLAVAVFLRSKGFDLNAVDLHVDGRQLELRNLTIDERGAGHFFQSPLVRIDYTLHGLHLTQARVEIDAPILTIRREQDGSFNLSKLLPSAGPSNAAAPARPAQPSTPLRAALNLRDATLLFINQFSPTRSGRHFAITSLDVVANIDQGAISSGRIKGIIESGNSRRPLGGSFIENDVVGLGQLEARAEHVKFGPLINYFVSSPAFTIVDGEASVVVHGYSVRGAGAPAAGWQLTAKGAASNTRLGLVPLIAQVRGVHGAFAFGDGILTLPQMRGSVAGLPLVANGAITLIPTVALHMHVISAGPLSKARNLLAALKRLPITGHLDAAVRVDGAPDNPRVGVAFSMPHGLAFAKTPIDTASGSLVLNNGHVTLPFVSARYNGFAAIANGDVDVGSTGPPSGQLIAMVKGPARNFPWAVDIDNSAWLTARLAVSGVVAQFEGDGFMQLRGRKTVIRTPLVAGNQQLAIGPLLASDPRGGSLWFTGTINKAAVAHFDATLMAHNFQFTSSGVQAALPGISAHLSGMPAGGGVLDGWAKIAGPLNNLGVAVDLQGRNLAFANMKMGSVGVTSIGTLSRSGSGRLLGQIQLNGASADVAGIPLGNAQALIGLNGDHFRVYAATARVAGGTLSAAGDFSLARKLPDALLVLANRINLGQLQIAGMPHVQGQVNALASATDPSAHLRASLAMTGRDLQMDGREASADADLIYNGRTLTSQDSRILIGDASAVSVSGSIQPSGNATNLSTAAMNVNASMRDADLTQLSGLLPSSPVSLSGGLDADFHITGAVRSPAVSGNLRSVAGTLRGVPYAGLHASVDAHPGDVALSDAGVTIGSTLLNVQGNLSSDRAALALNSPHLDLTDFNDFFGGKDVFAGTGAANVALSSSPSASRANGWMNLHDAAFGHVPLGTIQAAIFTPEFNDVAATITQRGAVGRSDLTLRAALPSGVGALAATRKAQYTATADVAATNLAALTPALPSAVAGLRGNLAIHARAHGSPTSMLGTMDFNLANGFIRKQPIGELRGSLSADHRGIALKTLQANMLGVNVAAHGRYNFNRHGGAHVVVSIPNMARSAQLLNLPDVADGAAALTLDASGTLANPRVDAGFDAHSGQAFGVAYDNVDLDTTYMPGRITVEKSFISLAQHRGDLAIDGTVPVPVGLAKRGKHLSVQSPLRIDFLAQNVNIAALDPLLHNQASLEGTLNANASATGTLANPVLAGSAALRGATIRSNFETVPITGLNADVAFTNNAIDLSKLHADVGSGTIDAFGAAHLSSTASGSGFGRVAYDLHFKARRANLTVPKYFSGVLDADLGIDTTRTEPLLAGDMIVSNANLPFSGILALAGGGGNSAPQSANVPGVPPVRKGHTIVYGGQIFGPKPQTLVATPAPHKSTPAPKPIALNLTASVGDNVNVTGLVNATGTGTLQISGTSTQPHIEGSVTALRGSVSAFNTTFNLVRAIVTFHPRDGLVPSIDAQAVAYRPEADITVTVTGRVDQLHTTLASDPPMSEQAILANILDINGINNAMSGGASGSSAFSAQGVAGSLLTSRLLSGINYGLEQTLHINEVDLAFDQNGDPTVELRQQYGKNLYALYRTSFSTPPQQTVGMLYEPRSWLEVEFLEKQNTAGQSYWQQPGQYYTFQATYKLPNAPAHAHHHHEPVQPQGQPVQIGP